MPTFRFDYAHAPTIAQFAQCDAFIRGLMGPFGSGKSSGCLAEIIRRGARQKPGADGVRRTRWAVIRNSYPQLRDTTIRTVHDWLPPRHWGQWRGQDHTYAIRMDDVEIEVLFRALDRPDQVANLLSLELTGAWVNEAREVPLAIIEALQGRVGRFPAVKDGGCTWSGVIMDTNPPDDDHWWYELFEQRKPRNAALFKQPSGLSPLAENISNLPNGYYTNLAEGKDPAYIKVYIDGEYGSVSDGKPIYDGSWRDSVHVKDFAIDEYAPLLVGMDFGLTPAAVIGWQTPFGQLRLRHEVIAEEIGIRRFVQQIFRPFMAEHYPGRRFAIIGDPAGNRRVDTDEKTVFDVLREEGYSPMAGESNEPKRRWESVNWYLTRMADGEPGFLLHPDCKTLRKGFNGGYRLRRLQVPGDVRYESRADKNKYSHPHDALQYLTMYARNDALITEDPEYSDTYDAPLEAYY